MSLAHRNTSKPTAQGKRKRIGGPRPEDQGDGSGVEIEDLGSRSASQESGEESEEDAGEPAQSPSAVSGIKARTTQGRTTRSTTRLASTTTLQGRTGKEEAGDSPPPARGKIAPSAKPSAKPLAKSLTKPSVKPSVKPSSSSSGTSATREHGPEDVDDEEHDELLRRERNGSWLP